MWFHLRISGLCLFVFTNLRLFRAYAKAGSDAVDTAQVPIKAFADEPSPGPLINRGVQNISGDTVENGMASM